MKKRPLFGPTTAIYQSRSSQKDLRKGCRVRVDLDYNLNLCSDWNPIIYMFREIHMNVHFDVWRLCCHVAFGNDILTFFAKLNSNSICLFIKRPHPMWLN